MLINFGTCGGFAGRINRGDIILALKTIIYDILEQMDEQDRAIERYSVDFDLSWLPKELPQNVLISTLLSADRDIVPSDIPELLQKYGVPVADWESGAIAWVANRNGIPILILRAISDLVGPQGGEAYGDYDFFAKQCQSIMADFAHHLPGWLEIMKQIEKPKYPDKP
jgi:adenosylhomocysteine nucleosidase